MRKDPENASLLAHLWADRRYVAILGLGFSSGIPFLLVYVTQSAWLSEAKVPIELMSELTIAYKFKFSGRRSSRNMTRRFSARFLAAAAAGSSFPRSPSCSRSPVLRLGMMRSLLVGTTAGSASHVSLAWLAADGGNDFWTFAIAVSIEGFAYAFAQVVLINYMSSLTATELAASQFAL